MTSTTRYVADLIDQIDRRHRTNSDRLISKWQIASTIDLFPAGQLQANRTLTPAQLAAVDQYIAKFKATPAGKEAIRFHEKTITA